MKELWVDSKRVANSLNLHHVEEKGKWTQIRVRSSNDIEKVREAQKEGAERIFIICNDWSVFPSRTLSSLSRKTKLIAKARDIKHAKELDEELDKKVHGILIVNARTDEVRKLLKYFAGESQMEFDSVSLNTVKRMGLGARSYIDTCELMSDTEGMLVGETTNVFFFIQAESDPENPHIRPFRVNAGAISSYVLLSENETRYLSELKVGDEALIVDRSGSVRKTFVGRNKIEHRPLVLIEAKLNGRTARAILQDSENVHIMTPKGTKSVSKLRKGDKVYAYLRKSRNRKGKEDPMEK